MNKKIYLSLGSNNHLALAYIKEACILLKQNKRIKNFENSHFYLTDPVEMISSDSFVNAVCSFKTDLSIQELFEWTQEVERKMGKLPKPKNASRLIDIDILFYDTLTYVDSSLCIPHQRWNQRLFVLQPLLDLTPSITLIDDKNHEEKHEIARLIEKISQDSLQFVSLLEKNPEMD